MNVPSLVVYSLSLPYTGDPGRSILRDTDWLGKRSTQGGTAAAEAGELILPEYDAGAAQQPLPRAAAAALPAPLVTHIKASLGGKL